MTRYIALLRGINVGGHRRVPMADLRALLGGLGHTGAATLLQSGNAVFTARPGAGGADGADGVRRELDTAIADRFGFAVDTVLRTAADLDRAVAANPLPVADPARFLVLFLREPPTPEERSALTALDPAPYAPAAMVPGAAELYFSLPAGLQNAKLPTAATRLLPNTVATGRNWRTVLRIQELAAAAE